MNKKRIVYFKGPEKTLGSIRKVTLSKEDKEPEKMISTENLARFFDYLEIRVINSSDENDKPSHDLLEMRFLSYVDVPSTQLGGKCLNDIVEVSHLGLKLFYIEHKGIRYFLTNNFIRLASLLLKKDEPFLYRSPKSRNRFVENIAKVLDLQGQISTKSIQKTMRYLIKQNSLIRKIHCDH